MTQTMDLSSLAHLGFGERYVIAAERVFDGTRVLEEHGVAVTGPLLAGVQVVSTLDTLSHCAGVMDNAARLIAAGVRLLYGTDLAHTDVPWGIDARELELMLHAGRGTLTPLDVLSAATARAGTHLGLAPLGQLVEDAPADLIGVRGNPLEQLKLLEYPDLVVSGGVPIVAPAE